MPGGQYALRLLSDRYAATLPCRERRPALVSCARPQWHAGGMQTDSTSNDSSSNNAAQRLRQRIAALPEPIRAQVQRMLQKLPADQIDALLASGSPLIERALQRAESAATAHRTGPAHPSQSATHTSSSSTELLAHSASRRVQTVVQGDHPGAGLWLLVVAIGVVIGLVYFMLRG